jgi:Arc/MetJ-type ribon-helix-helix transcriptional regulator
MLRKTSIRLSKQDDTLIEKIMEAFGFQCKMDAIRYALRRVRFPSSK